MTVCLCVCVFISFSTTVTTAPPCAQPAEHSKVLLLPSFNVFYSKYVSCFFLLLFHYIRDATVVLCTPYILFSFSYFIIISTQTNPVQSYFSELKEFKKINLDVKNTHLNKLKLKRKIKIKVKTRLNFIMSFYKIYRKPLVFVCLHWGVCCNIYSHSSFYSNNKNQTSVLYSFLKNVNFIFHTLAYRGAKTRK